MTPPLTTPSLTPAKTTLARNAWILIWLLLAILAVSDVYTLINALRTPALAQYFSIGLAFGSSASTLISAWLARRKQFSAAMWVLIGQTLIALFVANGLGKGLGLVYALTGLIIVSAIASLALPPRQRGLALAAAGVSGLLIFIFDVFGAADRPPTGNPAFTLGIFGVTAVMFIALLARQFRDYSLRAKLVITFTVVTALAVGGTAFFSDALNRQGLTANVGNNLQSRASTQAQAIGEQLVKVVDNLQAFGLSKVVQDQVEALGRASTGDLAELAILDTQWRAAVASANLADPLLQQVLNTDIASEMSEYQARFPENLEVMVTDKHGALVAASRPHPDYYQADERWWQVAYNNGAGKIFISQPQREDRFLGANNEQVPFLIIAAPLFGHNTTDVVGVLYTAIRLKTIADIVGKVRMGETGTADLLMPLQQVINGVNGQLESVYPVSEAVLLPLRADGFATLEYRNIASLASLAPVVTSDPEEMDWVAELGWAVLVHQEQSEALKSVDESQRLTLLTSVTAALLSAAVGFFVAQFLAGPIVRLTQAAEKVQSGDFTVQAPVESGDEIGALATTFNTMTAQIRDLVGSLEERVAARTRALGASSEVSRRLSTILDQQDLVREVVEQVQASFNYYHAHIYLFDAAQQNLVMAGGTGDAGRVMLARGHKIPRGRGLVGRAAETKQVVLVPDTRTDANWLPNALLPLTKAEVAVPITLGNKVLGVLDVQHDVAGGLTQADADLLQAIANQVAVALQNARSFTEAQRRAEREAAAVAISQKIQSATTPEMVLQVAAQELGQRLKARRATARVGVASPPHGDSQP